MSSSRTATHSDRRLSAGQEQLFVVRPSLQSQTPGHTTPRAWICCLVRHLRLVRVRILARPVLQLPQAGPLRPPAMFDNRQRPTGEVCLATDVRRGPRRRGVLQRGRAHLSLPSLRQLLTAGGRDASLRPRVTHAHNHHKTRHFRVSPFCAIGTHHPSRHRPPVTLARRTRAPGRGGCKGYGAARRPRPHPLSGSIPTLLRCPLPKPRLHCTSPRRPVPAPSAKRIRVLCALCVSVVRTSPAVPAASAGRRSRIK